MDQVTLEISISKTLKTQAESRAQKYGVTLAEIIQNLLTQFTRKEVPVSVERKDEEVVFLTARAERRYAKIHKDIQKGKNMRTAKTVAELMRQLQSDT